MRSLHMKNSGSLFQEISRGEQLPLESIPCNTKRVSESLSTEISKWEPGMSIFITAPTGSGKSTFVFEDLADHARKQNRSILVLSNRLALNLQQKNSLCEKFNLPTVSSKALVDQQIFGNIILMTYQSALSNIININGISPLFVVFDEAHFFCSDALFYFWTETILTKLIHLYPVAIRIYMSATPEDVKPAISAIEYKNRQLILDESGVHSLRNMLNRRMITDYVFPEDYSHISIKFFNHWDTILQIIKANADSSKWLIFVNQKETGKDLKAKFSNGNADFIDASSAHDRNVIEVLIRQQKFNKDVLITTKVIDNGINIKDVQLKNIVVDFTDFVELIQILGRKRTLPGEKINLYLKVPSIGTIKQYKRNAEKLYETIKSFEKNHSYIFGQVLKSSQMPVKPYFMGVPGSFHIRHSSRIFSHLGIS